MNGRDDYNEKAEKERERERKKRSQHTYLYSTLCNVKQCVVKYPKIRDETFSNGFSPPPPPSLYQFLAHRSLSR